MKGSWKCSRVGVCRACLSKGKKWGGLLRITISKQPGLPDTRSIVKPKANRRTFLVCSILEKESIVHHQQWVQNLYEVAFEFSIHFSKDFKGGFTLKQYPCFLSQYSWAKFFGDLTKEKYCFRLTLFPSGFVTWYTITMIKSIPTSRKFVIDWHFLLTGAKI